jgi:hypothetical protein
VWGDFFFKVQRSVTNSGVSPSFWSPVTVSYTSGISNGGKSKGGGGNGGNCTEMEMEYTGCTLP